MPPDQPSSSPPPHYVAPANDGLGVAPGAIKHVWMIILENKAYDATFTGLNHNGMTRPAFAGSVDKGGSVQSNPNFGQFVSAAGPNASPSANGCVCRRSVPTLFNQLDRAHVPWKVYNQDMGNPDESGSPMTRAHSTAVPTIRRSGPPVPVAASIRFTAARTRRISTSLITTRCRSLSRCCSPVTATRHTWRTCWTPMTGGITISSTSSRRPR